MIRYIEYNGYACPFETMPCSKCDFRYAYVCPVCKWGREHPNVNTYKGMTPLEVMKCVLHGKGFKDFKDICKEELNGNK